MFVKQITQNEALNLAAKGVEVMIMVPNSENNVWGNMTPDTLQNLLSGLMFFRREPALENPIIEDEEKVSTPDEPAADCVASGKERKKESRGGHRKANCPAQGRMDNRKDCR